MYSPNSSGGSANARVFLRKGQRRKGKDVSWCKHSMDRGGGRGRVCFQGEGGGFSGLWSELRGMNVSTSV